MALTGKTIGQLTYLQFPTNETLLPVEYVGDTYHISFSSITYNEGTYDQFLAEANNGVLTPGRFYLMTDYQTCYDQPNFDYAGNAIVTGNYKSGSTEPLLLLAIATDRFSPTVYSPSYPHDKITYDITWDTTEVTNSPAKGRITERIDEFGNRTDYDHRAVLFRRYKSYFKDGFAQGRITSMADGVVTGVNTDFVGQFTTGSTIFILSQNPKLYEVVSIESTTGMTVSGFVYENFTNSLGYEFLIMTPTPTSVPGTLYYFNDVPDTSNDIDDGGDDMYDGANEIYTNLFSRIPYTHTQMQDPPVNNTDEAAFGDFTYDGTVQDGELYFNSGSTYFTNLYPGLFVMSAYDVEITDFEIDGNIGADGDGQVDTFDYTLTYSGIDYSVYCKRVWDSGDPSINHIYIVDTIDENITHNIDESTDDDLDTISNLTGVTQVHYLLFALADSVKPTDTQIENVVNSYLSLINPTDIDETLSNLNSNFTDITSNLPANQSGFKSLEYKQSNLTGDTEDYKEYLTFTLASNRVINNFIGNYANTYQWDGLTFLLSNNVFFGTTSYVNNTFGNSCFNNTFDSSVTDNIIGNFFYNNTTDLSFDQNIIGNYFNNNYISTSFDRNKIGEGFNNNTIVTTGQFYDNTIDANFYVNVITNGVFYGNKIGSETYSNLIEDEFIRNDIGNGFYTNKIYSPFRVNSVTEEFYNNLIYSQFYENVIGGNFINNTIGDSQDISDNTFIRNNIGSAFQQNTITENFRDNNVGYYFQNNGIYNSPMYKNTFVTNVYNNTISGCSFQNNYFNDNVYGNNIQCDTFQNNTLGVGFYNNTIYYQISNNIVGAEFNQNYIGDEGTLNGFVFDSNVIKENFKSNDINGCDITNNFIGSNMVANTFNSNFIDNNIGNGFFLNSVNGQMRENQISNYFQQNNLQGTFLYNNIGNHFYDNTVGDGFGFGGGSYRGNVIGNNFNNNNIGEYFYDNTVQDNFTNNTVVDYFQINRVCNSVEFTDFSSATFVYGYYNCDIFRNSSSSLRLSYFSGDTLTVTNITD